MSEENINTVIHCPSRDHLLTLLCRRILGVDPVFEEDNKEQKTMNTDTPRTDAMIKSDCLDGIYGYMSEYAYDRMAELCLKLERELTAVTEQRDRLAEALKIAEKYLVDRNIETRGFEGRTVVLPAIRQALQSLTTNDQAHPRMPQ